MTIKHVVSLGVACPCAYALKKAGVKLYSCPFDWIISSTDMVIDCIETDFRNFLNDEFLYHTDDRLCNDPQNPYCHHAL